MMFGITIDEATSFRILDRFVDEGGEWIDTADCYAFWASEAATAATASDCSAAGSLPAPACATA